MFKVIYEKIYFFFKKNTLIYINYFFLKKLFFFLKIFFRYFLLVLNSILILKIPFLFCEHLKAFFANVIRLLEHLLLCRKVKKGNT